MWRISYHLSKKAILRGGFFVYMWGVECIWKKCVNFAGNGDSARNQILSGRKPNVVFADRRARASGKLPIKRSFVALTKDSSREAAAFSVTYEKKHPEGCSSYTFKPLTRYSLL